MGVCAGGSPVQSTQGVKSAATANWIGGGLAGLGFGAETWTYNAGPPAYYSLLFNGAAVKRGAAYSSNGGNSGTTYYLPVAGSGNRGFFFVDIIKGATYSVNLFLPTSAGLGQTNYNMDDLVYGCQQCRTGLLTLRGSSMLRTSGSQINRTMDESTGALDSASLYWNNSSNFLEVYGMCVYATWKSGSN